MENILVTAFDPFGGDETNSSQIVLNLLPDKIENVIINKMVVPTVYVTSAEQAFERATRENSFAVISLGQAGKSESVRIETIGINYALASIEDNKGARLYGEKLFKEGENAYFSTLPVKEIEKAIKVKGYNCTLSCSAGGFVCNSMLYTLLKCAEENKKRVMCGFIHLPYCKSQNKDAFSMDENELALCVIEAIKTVIKINRERNFGICAE